MRALRWYGRNDVRVDDVPVPKIERSSQIIIKTKACGICGTDIHEYVAGPIFLPDKSPNPLTGATVPIILGHEPAGIVVEVGKDVKKFKPDDRVAICPVISCGVCEWCRQDLRGLCTNGATLGLSDVSGGFSEYMRVEEYMCYKIPSGVSYEEASIAGPVAEAIHSIGKAEPEEGEVGAIIGAGTIGLLLVQVARYLGCKDVYVVEIDQVRRQCAKEFGATEVINPKTTDVEKNIRELTSGRGVDFVVEAVGNEETGLLAGRLARIRGRISILGIFSKPSPLDFLDLVVGEKKITGSVTGYGDFPQALQMIAEKEVALDRLITGTATLDDLPTFFEKLGTKSTEDIKVIAKL